MNQDPIPQPEIERPGLSEKELNQSRSDRLEKDREELAAWLNKNPEDASQLEDLQDLVSLCRQFEPSYPSDEAWEPVLRGVVAGTGTASVSGAGASGGRETLRFYERAIRTSLMGAAAAAAFILAVLLPGHPPPTGIEPIPFIGPEGLPIVDANDVELMSMEGDDTRLLVVGNPPVSAPLVLVGHGDITIADEYTRRFQVSPGPDSLMIVAPKPDQDSKSRRGP